MHKSKGWWRGRTRRTRVRKREEKERKETGTNAWKPDWNIRGSNAPGEGHPGVALDWNSGEETALDRSGRGCKKRRKRRRQDAARRT